MQLKRIAETCFAIAMVAPACSAPHQTPVREPSPFSASLAQAPRVVFSAEHCAHLQTEGVRGTCRAGPYWTPTSDQVEAMVASLSQAPVDLERPFQEYALQFFGRTKGGRQVLQVVGTCPRLWMRNPTLLLEYPWDLVPCIDLFRL